MLRLQLPPSLPLAPPYRPLRSGTLLRTTSGEQVYGSIAAGNLYGLPIVASASVPAGRMQLGNAPAVLYADSGLVIDASREASLQMDLAPATPPAPIVSLWQNMAALRVERVRQLADAPRRRRPDHHRGDPPVGPGRSGADD